MKIQRHFLAVTILVSGTLLAVQPEPAFAAQDTDMTLTCSGPGYNYALCHTTPTNLTSYQWTIPQGSPSSYFQPIGNGSAATLNCPSWSGYHTVQVSGYNGATMFDCVTLRTYCGLGI